MKLPTVNRYTNDDADDVFYVLFSLFVLWWIFILAANVFGGFGGLFRRHRAAPAVAGPGVGPNAVGPNVAAPVAVEGGVGGANADGTRRGGLLRRIERSLEVIFLSSLAVVLFNYLVNGLTHTFLIWFSVVAGLGVLWALGRGFVHRFADLLLLAIIPLFVYLWINGFVHKSFLTNVVPE